MKFRLSIPMMIILFTSISFAQIFNFNNEISRTKRNRYDKEFMKWVDDGYPFLEINYGYNENKHELFSKNFTKTGMAEIKLGYSTTEKYLKRYLVENNDKFIFFSRFSNELNKIDDNLSKSETEVKGLRFGIATRGGYGYKTGTFTFIPYNQSSFTWTQLDFRLPPANILNTSNLITGDDLKITSRYQDKFRFGTSVEAGFRFNFASTISFNAGYEANVVFPRHLFWKHLLSYGIEGLANKSLDYFVDEVISSSPVSGPIINFLLKNGLAYSFYLLRKKDMNWPFATEAPFTFETFKVGLTFTF